MATENIEHKIEHEIERDIEQRFKLLGKEPEIISLMLLSAFAAMGAILMTPALPQIAKYFGIGVGSAQLTVTSFLLGYAFGQLIYGPIANRFGRKPAFYIGIAIATLGSLFSILSSPFESFHLLILGRFLEALGSSAGLVVCFTIINDFYYPDQARKIIAFVMLAFAIVPGIAIAIGGALTQYIHWQACFYFLFLYGLCLLYFAYRLPETIVERDYKALHYQHIFKHYAEIFVNKKLIGFAMTAGFSSACIYVFGAEGPFIGIHLLNIPPATYGLLALTPFIGTVIGSLSMLRLTKINALTLIKSAYTLEVIAALAMLLLFIFHGVTIYTMLILMGIFCIGYPMVSGTSLTSAMSQTEDKSNGSAVMNFIGMSMPVLMTLLLSVLHIGAAIIMPIVFLISLFLTCVVYFLLVRNGQSSRKPEP